MNEKNNAVAQDDGGPAFPGEHVNQDVLRTLRERRDIFSAQDARDIASKHAGMSLRAYIASGVLAGFAAKGDDHQEARIKVRAKVAVAYADALMEALKQ